MKNLKKIKDPLKRRVYFIASITKEIKREGEKPPLIVGGEALEIYTQGNYTTGDIDLKAPKKILEKTLKKWKFKKIGRIWYSNELDIYIDWQGEKLDEGEEAENRINKILIEKDMEIYVISIEDLIIDRLASFKFWKDSDGFMWAMVLLEIKKAMGSEIDLKYLKKRAKITGIEDVLKKLLKGSKNERI